MLLKRGSWRIFLERWGMLPVPPEPQNRLVIRIVAKAARVAAVTSLETGCGYRLGHARDSRRTASSLASIDQDYHLLCRRAADNLWQNIS